MHIMEHLLIKEKVTMSVDDATGPCNLSHWLKSPDEQLLLFFSEFSLATLFPQFLTQTGGRKG